RLGREPMVVPHPVQDAALHRLQAVAHVGERAGGDDAQRIVEVAAARLLVEGRRRVASAAPAAGQLPVLSWPGLAAPRLQCRVLSCHRLVPGARLLGKKARKSARFSPVAPCSSPSILTAGAHVARNGGRLKKCPTGVRSPLCWCPRGRTWAKQR